MIKKSFLMLGVIALANISLPALACDSRSAAASTGTVSEGDRKISSEPLKQDSGQQVAYNDYEARKKALREHFKRFEQRRGNLEDRY